MIIDKDDLGAEWVKAELIDADNRIAVMVGWRDPKAKDQTIRHAGDWDVDLFSRDTCRAYFESFAGRQGVICRDT